MTELTNIYGLRAIIEAIESGENIDKIFLQRGLKGDLFKRLEQLSQNNNINLSYVPQQKLDRLSKRNHQGAIAYIAPIAFVDIDDLITNALNTDRPPLFLLLDQLSDVRNFGAIIRTAECTGVNGIIIQKKGGAPINADTIKTSAGAIFKIPICKVDHIKDAIYHLQSADIQVVAATEKASKDIYDLDLKSATAIVMGSEGKGINPSVLKIVDHHGKLPILGEIASLNVSVACGAILYETVRQRKQ
ncbi:23S rRNA (guanosine(2251)-2'-O)-methyltransferase RlmB [Sungkyunkwania multivorans]|uniref:23S rRNA (Guanosine(2251)-2'-O)-methyltransferase RlmB n=1 Tax=Sungkyunkwania multivorans TaxID=1173618 RepID=A0ABW3CW20_9FLAO